MKTFIKRNGATILTVLGGIGTVATSVMAVKATPKALEKIKMAEEDKGEELTKIETIRVAGTSYIPAIVTGVGTLVCIFGANIMNKRQQAALVSAYALLNSSYEEYKQKLKELYGEEAHQEIIDAIAAEKAENIGVRAPGYVATNNLFVDEQCGETRLFYDEYGQRFFEATLEQVISAEYHLNRNYVLRGYTVLNEFYDFLGIDPTSEGNELGWAISDDGTFWIDFHHRITNIKGYDCVVIEMPFAPDLEWQELY